MTSEETTKPEYNEGSEKSNVNGKTTQLIPRKRRRDLLVEYINKIKRTDLIASENATTPLPDKAKLMSPAMTEEDTETSTRPTPSSDKGNTISNSNNVNLASVSWKSKLRSQIPIVTIHGIKGSVLVRKPTNNNTTNTAISSTSSVLWLTGPQAAGFSTPALSLPIVWNTEFEDIAKISGDNSNTFNTQERDNIHPLHTLKAVTIIPYLVGTNLYDIWLKKAETLGTSAYEFAYDWRRSNCETVMKFVAYISWISARHDGMKVQVVAHSMGGLICLGALHLAPNLFHSVLLAASPLVGGPGLMVDLHKGVVNGRNSKILAPNVVATFPSYYSLAQAKWEYDSGYTGLLDTEGKYIDIDWYDVEDWKKHKLGFFADESLSATEKENLLSHLKHCLSDGLKFRNTLKPKNPSVFKYPPITVIASDNIETRWLIIKDGPQSVRGYDFDTADKAPGDGRVPVEFARPKGIPHVFYKSGLSHENILNDPRIPGFLEEMVTQVAASGVIKNPMHPKL